MDKRSLVLNRLFRGAQLRPSASCRSPPRTSRIATRVENDARRSVTFSAGLDRNLLCRAMHLKARLMHPGVSSDGHGGHLSGGYLATACRADRSAPIPDDIELPTAVSKHHSSRDGTGGDHDGCFAARSDDHRRLADRDDMPCYLAARLVREPASGERNRSASLRAHRHGRISDSGSVGQPRAHWLMGPHSLQISDVRALAWWRTRLDRKRN